MIEHFKKLYNIPEKYIEILYDIVGDRPGRMGYCCGLIIEGIDISVVVDMAMKMVNNDGIEHLRI